MFKREFNLYSPRNVILFNDIYLHQDLLYYVMGMNIVLYYGPVVRSRNKSGGYNSTDDINNNYTYNQWYNKCGYRSIFLLFVGGRGKAYKDNVYIIIIVIIVLTSLTRYWKSTDTASKPLVTCCN